VTGAAFEEMFRAAPGRAPGSWLTRAAVDGLPESLEVPGGTSPAEVILAWLWRHQPPDNSKRREARRLVYALPEGIIVELLERYGPFVLACLETVVRIADWRASGGRELPLTL
jgi:hypothetical protein